MESLIKQLESCANDMHFATKQGKIPTFYDYTEYQRIDFLGFQLDLLAVIRAMKKINSENQYPGDIENNKLSWKDRYNLIKRILIED